MKIIHHKISFSSIIGPSAGAISCTGKNISECSSIEHTFCNIVTLRCECLEGFLPVYDKIQPMKLKYCKDPIVLTSSVGGYCLIDKHCSALPGTICTDDYPGEGGTFKRCECQDDLKPALPDPTLGIIKRCIGPNDEGVLSLISQALFGDNSGPNKVPVKVSLKLNEKALLDSCSSSVRFSEDFPHRFSFISIHFLDDSG